MHGTGTESAFDHVSSETGHRQPPRNVWAMDNVFRPGAVAAVLLDADTDTPSLRSTRVHDCHPATRSLVISQTAPRLPSRPGLQYYLTTVVRVADGEDIRLGVEVVVLEGIPAYRLPGGQTEPAIRVLVKGAPQPMNVRTAYRLHPHEKIRLDVVLVRDQQRYRAGESFFVYDLSIGGMGFLIPRHVGGDRNPLLAILPRDTMGIELNLAVEGDPEPTVLQGDFQVVQMNKAYSEVSHHAGGRLVELDSKAQQILSRFITRAQIASR